MKKLTELRQDDLGLFCVGKTLIQWIDLIPLGKIKTLSIRNPTPVSEVIDEMAENDSSFIPHFANAYASSEFDGITQHVRRNERTGKEEMWAVYGIQFYHVRD